MFHALSEADASRIARALAAVRSRLLILAGVLALTLALAIPAAANATIASVFEGKVTCAEQTGANAGQRWCGTTAGTTVPTWDGTQIDVTVGFPAATGADNNYPVVGIFQPWDGTKILPSSTQAQRWLKLGYAVFSMSDRGWGGSCQNSEKAKATCEHGYIHLMSRRYEVRDAQYLLGLLADEGVINGQQIGAIGESYGGGMSVQLGSLKNRVELLNGELVPWTSPKGKSMRIAATAPEWEWTDFAQSLEPNGSNLDYVTEDPYSGVLGNNEFGIEKRNWNESLYLGGQLIGKAYYQAKPEEPEAAITEYYELDQTGGPYGGLALAEQQEKTLPVHGAYYTSLAEEPAPALLQNGWNDDLFPVDQAVLYYNKVRAKYPHAPIQLFALDFGHNPRSASSPSAAEVAALNSAQNEWFEYYVKGQGSEPAHAQGGVTAITSACSAETTTTGVTLKANNWASLAAGEVNLKGVAEQTIEAPGTAPKTAFTSGTVCTTEANGENTSAATYKTAAAPSGGYTIAGSPTVIGEFSTPIKNDQVIARLLDVETGGTGKQRLIARAIYRPINPEGGFTKQVFQLHPQAWKVEAGHILKLQLLIQDSTYARTSTSTGTSAASVKVKNLELRVPTVEGAGSAEGQITKPLPKYLPPAYTLARNVAPAPPTAPHLTSGSTPNNNGVFTLAWESTQTAAAPSYTLQHKNASGGWSTVASGLSSPEYAFTSGSPEGEGTWTYRAIETNEGGESEPSEASSEVKVDETAPYAPTASASRAPDYSGKGGWYKNSVEVSFSSNGDPALSDGSAGSGVSPASIHGPVTFETNGSHEACSRLRDLVGNESAPGCLTVQVETVGPSLEINCPASALVGEETHATYSASDEYSGLASEASGTVPINTETAGEKTVSTTAISNVGLENTKSCSTVVGYPKPGAPTLSAGTSPNDSGLFTLSWTGPNPVSYLGLSYTLQHHNQASGEWTTVASGIEALSYEFTGSGEQEGTWEYRVIGIDETHMQDSEPSEASAPVKVDKSAPNAPTAAASRAPDYAGKGGWYKDGVEVSFTSNGDPNLADGSAGSGVNPASIPATQSFETNGSHEACGTVSDFAGNESAPGCLTVQVETVGPSLEISCPATAEVGEKGVAASYSASDEFSGLASEASGTVPINTETAGEKTVSTTAVSNVGLENTKSCSTVVGYPKPGAPTLSAGTTPNDSGLFTLSWTGPDPMSYLGLSYTLQQHNAASGEWMTVASGIEALSYEFTGSGEQEGTWEYRVIGIDETHMQDSPPSDASSPVKVDETAPNAPTASATRPPDYAGKGGWYKDSVEVSFTSNGDPKLSDTSAGSGVNPASIPTTQSFNTNGSHEACGKVRDFAGNESVAGCLTVQVETVGPSLEISCPAEVAIGASGVHATVTATDAYSGLKVDPSGTVPINTSKAGDQTVTRTAVSNVGLEATRSCTTHVGYFVVVTGTVKGALTVRNGEAVELAPGSKVDGKVSVRSGGALDVESATLGSSLVAHGPALVRVCGSSIGGALDVSASSGALVIGEGNGECAGNSIGKSSTLKSNTQGVLVDSNTVGGSLSVTSNTGGTTVVHNKVTRTLSVLRNAAPVTDAPNESGRSKLQ